MAKKTKAPLYKLSLTMGDKTYTNSSDDITEAFLGLKPEKLGGWGRFTLEHDGKSASLIKNIFQTRFILSHGLRAFYFARRLLALLK